MSKSDRSIGIIAILLLCGLMFYIGQESVKANIKTRTEYVYDTITISREVPVEVVNERLVEIPQDVDTSAILEDYFTSREFETMVSAADCEITAKGAVFKNNLEGINFSVTNTRPTEINNTVELLEPNKIAAGMLVGQDLIAPTVSYQYDRYRVQGGYNFQNESWLVGFEVALFSW